MTYSIKEIFYTLQGEGAQAGSPAVFCRFAGCNLWSGLERDRAKAQCSFCDTDFVKTDGLNGGQFSTAQELAQKCHSIWGGDTSENMLIVLTGGEPMLQVDGPLISALKKQGFRIAIESNGTLVVPREIDWICISPKADVPLVQTSGDELKLVYPQQENSPKQFEKLDFSHFFLQPLDIQQDQQLDNDRQGDHTTAAIDYCLKHPKWKLSLQTHKVTGIP